MKKRLTTKREMYKQANALWDDACSCKRSFWLEQAQLDSIYVDWMWSKLPLKIQKILVNLPEDI